MGVKQTLRLVSPVAVRLRGGTVSREHDTPLRRADPNPTLDALTGLANRDEILATITAALVDLGPDQHFSVLLVDIDGFREFNDALGPAQGDELLCMVADRLTASTRPGDTIGRLTGDEFVIVAYGCHSLAARAMAAGFASIFEPPFELGGRQLTLTASVGVASTTGSTDRATQLVHNATAAMHAAKATGRNRHHIFTDELHHTNRTRLELLERLRGVAMTARELTMVYQPIVELATGAVVGAEALVRWNHPELGLLMPDAFIPLAEDNDLIVPLSMWILTDVAATIADWQSRAIMLQVGVNVSPAHFAAGTLATDVIDIVDTHGIERGRLALELAESQTLHDLDAVHYQLRDVQRHGVLIAIDDFGSGFSSLERLATLPVDILKIDRSLTQHLDSTNLHRRRAMTTLCTALVDVTTTLGKDTVIEGIETTEQLRICTDMGVTFGQGHLLGRPMPVAELEQYITRHSSHSESA
ncbi:bifunctional diguanylate cyclase/phosphodiesterase [Rhodococcus fascians]|nr:bifunctional diguanylate cyclase/phosphodiesterase [Rhodococcus fascians]MBY3808796.1 bifunctional diguanylate cyclase/phosphodiesterase [Rhodococcus fascians]MBY3841256.1 bifunctional diguanylate cyclase/phosphodiesterase [Rhodococcus fascians]MBY3847354.1 bifunctional diguanylate cyclase/phosphodiesterase [Rhodococcus fascians]MBY3852650.1 bifunctional diguanylate cyclase/phosphodiesterase [Rhodococcus fascians]